MTNKQGQRAERGDTVTLHFTALLDDGTEIESSREGEPISFVVGSGAVLPGLDEEVRRMAVGDKRLAVLKPADAFGERQEDLVKQVPVASLPPHLDLTPGKRIGATTPDGERIEMNVLARDDDTVTLDANHPFAGLDITFRIEILTIKKA